METKSPQAERILQALQSLYVKATAEFMDLVLGDQTALNAMFQSGSFKLHCLIPEGERVLKMFCHSFLKTVPQDIVAIDVDREAYWCLLAEVYPCLLAHNIMEKMKPHERRASERDAMSFHFISFLHFLGGLPFSKAGFQGALLYKYIYKVKYNCDNK